MSPIGVFQYSKGRSSSVFISIVPFMFLPDNTNALLIWIIKNRWVSSKIGRYQTSWRWSEYHLWASFHQVWMDILSLIGNFCRDNQASRWPFELKWRIVAQVYMILSQNLVAGTTRYKRHLFSRSFFWRNRQPHKIGNHLSFPFDRDWSAFFKFVLIF